MSRPHSVPTPVTAGEHPSDLAALLRACVDDPRRVTTDLPRRVAAAHDASPYLFAPGPWSARRPRPRSEH
ncbi:hypothetical protein [Streptomyces sp. NPDC004324]